MATALDHDADFLLEEFCRAWCLQNAAIARLVLPAIADDEVRDLERALGLIP